MSESKLKQKSNQLNRTNTVQRSNRVGSLTSTRNIAKIGILSAVAIILMYMEFSIPFMPVFLKFDFAEVPALLGAFSMGPLAGVIIELIKNLSHLPLSHTSYIGELANFLVCGSFVFVSGLIYQKNKTKKGAIISLISGTFVLALVGVLVNYFINLPFYANAMGIDLDTIIGMSKTAGNTLVTDMRSLLAFVFVPFNLFKGAVISIIVILIYKKLSPLLHK